MECVRPNRSDVHLTGEEAAKAEAAARGYFDAAAPKRHTKPQRSEYSVDYADALSGDDQVIAEYAHFQELEKDTEVIFDYIDLKFYFHSRNWSGISVLEFRIGVGDLESSRSRISIEKLIVKLWCSWHVF